MLTWGYKSTLLSTLITIRYEKPINTLDDLDRSGLPFLLVRWSASQITIANDPRQIMKRIYSRSIVFALSKEAEAQYAEMYLVMKE